MSINGVLLVVAEDIARRVLSGDIEPTDRAIGSSVKLGLGQDWDVAAAMFVWVPGLETHSRGEAVVIVPGQCDLIAEALDPLSDNEVLDQLADISDGGWVIMHEPHPDEKPLVHTGRLELIAEIRKSVQQCVQSQSALITIIEQ